MVVKEILIKGNVTVGNTVTNLAACLPDFADDMPCDPEYCTPDAYNVCNPEMDEDGGCDPSYDDD